MQFVPYSALYIDLTFSYLFKNGFQALKSHDAKKALTGLESVFIQDPLKEKLLVTICVRGALDLVLQGLSYPPGTEILMSSMNIPDMVKVVRYHGLIPVPVDVDFKTLKPKIGLLDKSINKNTKAIILAWVYGSYNQAEEIYKLCKDKGLFIIEDCAETFFDTKFNGNASSDVSLFSFGTIKLNTALGGALTVVRNNEVLYRKMNYILGRYPQEPISFFMRRLVKGMAIMLALNNTKVNVLIRKSMSALHVDYKERAISLVRGFQPDENFLNTFRKKLPDAMVFFLYLRMKSYDKGDFLRGTKRQLEGQHILENNGIMVPGSQSDKKFYWLYPVIVPDRELCYKMLNNRGIDAYLGTTQLRPVVTPMGSKYKEPTETLELFDKILYLPIHKNVPLPEVRTICKVVVDTVKEVEIIRRRKGFPKPKI